MLRNEQGSSLIALIFTIVLAVTGAAGYYIYQKSQDSKENKTNNSQQEGQNNGEPDDDSQAKNQRNNQRQNDAARIIGAINECLPNNNGDPSSCDDEQNLKAYISGLDIIKKINYNLTDYPNEVDVANVAFGFKCGDEEVNSDGDGLTVSSSRSFVVQFQLESYGNNHQLDTMCLNS